MRRRMDNYYFSGNNILSHLLKAILFSLKIFSIESPVNVMQIKIYFRRRNAFCVAQSLCLPSSCHEDRLFIG